MKPWKTPYLLLVVISSCFVLLSSCGTRTTNSPATPTPSGRTPTAMSTALPTPQPTRPPSACGACSQVSTPNVGASSNFLGVTALASNDVWAVGSYSNGQSPLIEHWNGTQWAVATSPTLPGSLAGIAAVSANDIWAVGENDSSNQQETLIEHWDGKVWKIVPSPNFAPTENTLAAISVNSATDIWAVGTTISASSSSYQPLIEHWNGTQWSLSSSPALSGRLFGVVAINSNDAWAVGWDANGTSSQPALIEHWDGAQWGVVSSPSPGLAFNTLNAVVKITANNIWAAGDSSNSVGPYADYSPLIEHWNGTQWSVVTSLLQGTSDFVNGMVAISSTNITVVGEDRTGLDPQGPYYTLVEHWDGRQWSVSSSPSPGPDGNHLQAAVQVPGTSSIWAVGAAYSDNVSQTLTEFRC